MAKFHYSFVLLFVAICAAGVNFAFRLRITRSWRIFLVTDAVILAFYSAWDIWAIKNRNWRFDPHQILGFKFFGLLPIEEVLFFIVVPLMTILSYVALSKLLPKMAIGEKP